jgi:hypothetical protein
MLTYAFATPQRGENAKNRGEKGVKVLFEAKKDGRSLCRP